MGPFNMVLCSAVRVLFNAPGTNKNLQFKWDGRDSKSDRPSRSENGLVKCAPLIEGRFAVAMFVCI